MHPSIFIETERLYLRQWKPEDGASYILMNLDPAVMEHYPALLTAEQSSSHFQTIRDHISKNGYGLFAIELKAGGQFIGYTGFSHPGFEAWFTPCVEIGWRIAAGYWNKGYATEAAKACLHFGFEKMGWEKIYSFTSLLNNRSENVMKKAGMQKEAEFDHPLLAAGHPLQKHVLYQISQNKP